MSGTHRGIWQTAHGWLHERIHQARLRARAERALPRRQRWRRFLRQGLVELAALYVAVNVLGLLLVPIVVTGWIECRAVDAATGAPVAGAVVWRQEGELGVGTDAAGLARLKVVTTPRLFWALPMLGTYQLGGQLHAKAEGWLAAEAPLPERFEWPLFGEPRVAVVIRMAR